MKIMNSDFRKFRRLALTAKILLAMIALGLPAALICSTFFGNGVGAMVGACALLILGIPAAICEYAAYDNLICPHCGQRAVKPHREFPSDKENLARFKAISKGDPITCVHCHQTIETA